MKYRAIQSSVPLSESLSQLSHLAERVYWRMLAVTDSWGRLHGSPAKVKALAVPLVQVNNSNLSHALDELEQAGRIRRYKGIDDRGTEQTLCQIVDFDINQPPEFLRKRGPSKFSEPPKRRDLQETPGNGRTSPENLSRAKRQTEKVEEQAPNGAMSTSVSTTTAVRRVYEHWRTARGKTDRRYDQISTERRRKIQARLREFSEEELHRAIDAVALDTWEDRPRHDDLIKLFRSQETVDRWLELSKQAKGEEPGENIRRLIAAKGLE